MKELNYTMIADGSSDKVLIKILTWLLRENGISIPINYFDINFSNSDASSKILSNKISLALQLCKRQHTSECHLLFIHRDAENQGWQQRYDEIQKALKQARNVKFEQTVPIIPVRMTEAWLLLDAQAIRKAAENPGGRARLDLPKISTLESLPDPKSCLRDLLLTAKEWTGRRRNDFAWEAAVWEIPENITDFSPLRNLAAFNKLEQHLKSVIQAQGWAHYP